MTTTQIRRLPSHGMERPLASLMPDLLKFFVYRLSDRDDAADALSETLMVLWRRRADAPTDDDSFRRWSYGVARRVLANAYRGRGRRTALSARLRDHLRASDPPADDVVTEVRRAISTLAPIDRDLVIMVAWEGATVAEAAGALGLKPSTARSRYARARARLREML